ncbi:MAG TPA: nucleoside triphosphate pyrophosphohydrolase [Verrucomicrobiae bacterium]|jgi:predicted house-cleaning noncanonical NTP pyrophosphatase (MazG superfamily)|nr:nucleoside triphosphate pyrophosphohydrolase [Verrucomicrobiae bacterium]
MSKKIYNKLVRDKIPEIIQADGKALKTRILSDQEHLEALIEKLAEEYEEFKEAKNVEELADLHEVLLALADALNIPREQLEKVRRDKATKRGAFKQKIYLESVE